MTEPVDSPRQQLREGEQVRRLEDALVILWAELPTRETLALCHEMPALADFLRHLHGSIEHERAMVRRNVWADAKC